MYLSQWYVHKNKYIFTLKEGSQYYVKKENQRMLQTN